MITKTTIKLLVRKIISLKDMPKSGYGSLFIDYDSHAGYEVRLITEDSVSTPFQTTRLKPKEMYDRLCTEIAKIKKEQEIIKNFQKNLAMETSTYSDEQMFAFLSMNRFSDKGDGMGLIKFIAQLQDEFPPTQQIEPTRKKLKKI